MKTKYYWKVAKKTNEPDKFASAMYSDTEPSCLNLIYRVGQDTFPQVGKILVFNTRENARGFWCARRSSCKILKVVAKNPQPQRFILRFIPYNWTVLDLNKFWNTSEGEYLADSPVGTYGADSVQVIEVAR